ncbi:hypothetical protein ACK2M2_16345, partial [Acinetobacter sp. TY1]|uniref:hypothetical protein n=1 Tax=Acinetobacter sp. TY1 TaxID=3387626 RepID=UPI003AF73140
TTYPSYALNLAQLGALCISNLCATKPFAEPNSHEEKGDINLLTAPYWWVSVGIGSCTYPINSADDLQKYLDRLSK